MFRQHNVPICSALFRFIAPAADRHSSFWLQTSKISINRFKHSTYTHMYVAHKTQRIEMLNANKIIFAFKIIRYTLRKWNSEFSVNTLSQAQFCRIIFFILTNVVWKIISEIETHLSCLRDENIIRVRLGTVYGRIRSTFQFERLNVNWWIFICILYIMLLCYASII